uniref:Phosphoribosylformylglycinamidine synthase 2 n=1 Tax=Lygus hesperus TaxID=30085 RepID=A0A0A9VXC1_LYGHE
MYTHKDLSAVCDANLFRLEYFRTFSRHLSLPQLENNIQNRMLRLKQTEDEALRRLHASQQVNELVSVYDQSDMDALNMQESSDDERYDAIVESQSVHHDELDVEFSLQVHTPSSDSDSISSNRSSNTPLVSTKTHKNIKGTENAKKTKKSTKKRTHIREPIYT